MTKVKIKQFKDKGNNPVAGLTPEHAVYGSDGVRLDAKLLEVQRQAAQGATAEEIRQAMENLPDGQAVSAQVAVNSAKISEVERKMGDYVENPEYIRVITDKDGKIIEGITREGGKVINIPTNFNAIPTANGERLVTESEWEEVKQVHEFIENPEFLDVTLDSKKQMISSVNREGETTFYRDIHVKGKVHSEGADRLAKGYIFVASSEASESIKEEADFVCTGVNDEDVISAALGVCGESGTVKLSSGKFYIDRFKKRNADNNYVAIVMGWYGSQNVVNLDQHLEGVDSRGDGKTEIYVRPSAFDSVPSGVQPSVIGTWPYNKYWGFHLSNFSITLEDNQHKVCCINLQYIGHGNHSNIFMEVAGHNVSNPTKTPPVEGCVGIRSYFGSDTGVLQIWKNIYAGGFYEAFQMGSEHQVCINCGGRFNYYCWTFGNYDYRQGTNDHPITLINCMDEHSCCLPYFGRCGWHDDDPTGEWGTYKEKALQSVNWISCNLESLEPMAGKATKLAEESVLGRFCGRIEYTCGGAGYNSVSQAFWKSGHGINFETINLAHAKGGTTAMRQTYTPNYCQTFFDSTLNKMLVYDGARWRDFNGNIVE